VYHSRSICITPIDIYINTCKFLSSDLSLKCLTFSNNLLCGKIESPLHFYNLHSLINFSLLAKFPFPSLLLHSQYMYIICRYYKLFKKYCDSFVDSLSAFWLLNMMSYYITMYRSFIICWLRCMTYKYILKGPHYFTH